MMIEKYTSIFLKLLLAASVTAANLYDTNAYNPSDQSHPMPHPTEI